MSLHCGAAVLGLTFRMEGAAKLKIKRLEYREPLSSDPAMALNNPVSLGVVIESSFAECVSVGRVAANRLHEVEDGVRLVLAL